MIFKRIYPILLLVLALSSYVLSTGCKAVKLADAEQAERNEEYFKAANLYYTLYRRLPRDKREQRGYMAFHAAENYYLQRSLLKALTSYQNALRYDYPDSIVYLKIGQCYQYMGKYKEALKYFKDFEKNHPMDTLAKIGIEGSEMALREKAETESVTGEVNPFQTYKVRLSPTLNSARADFSATYSPDGAIIYFTSSRSKDPSIDISNITGVKPNDIYRVKRDAKGKYSRADSVSGGVNTSADEGTPAFSGDGKTVYYTYAEDHELYSRTAKVYSTRSSESGLSKGTEVTLSTDSLHLAAHPAPSPDGKWLYFVSDGPGSLGGKDIYRAPIKDGLCGTPENLGSEINTPGNEMFPYMYTDSIMYFSSDGRPGYGGLDIYKAQLDSLGHWQVSHMPVPLNSSADDFGFVIDPSKREPDDPIAISGLLSSNRRDAYGRPHLYEFSRRAIKTDIEGVVYNRLGEPLSKAWVRIVGSNGPVGQGMVFTREDGSYKIAVDGSTEYVMLAGADNYLNQYIRFQTDSAKRSETYYIDFYLASRINPEKLDNIHYDFDKATLRPDSKSSLDELIKILNDNPEVSIRLTAHADRKGPVAYNQKLSERRAQSVVKYLIDHAIDQSRLFASGEGKMVPHIVNSKEAKQYDFLQKGDTLTDSFINALLPQYQAIADQLNRRTEFKVLNEKEVKALIEQKRNEQKNDPKTVVEDSPKLNAPDLKETIETTKEESSTSDKKSHNPNENLTFGPEDHNDKNLKDASDIRPKVNLEDIEDNKAERKPYNKERPKRSVKNPMKDK